MDRDFRAPAPNQLWVTDLTYVRPACGRFCYTALVTDAFSRAIVGWQVGDSLEAELPLDALEMALWARKQKLSAALVHHSDRGDTAEAVAATADWVYWYNNERLHSWCDYRPPLEFEQVYWQDRPGQPPVAA